MRVLLGVTGGIAAYKACELVRRLRDGGGAASTGGAGTAAGGSSTARGAAAAGAATAAARPGAPLGPGGHEVTVVMTEAATRFVTPMTFEVLSGRPVATSLFRTDDERIEHIALARWPDVIVVAPATANTIARFAHGLADDLLSTIVLASRPEVPVVVAPAMNTVMWENPIVQRNIRTLEELGRFRFVAPAAKTLACGEHGAGALAEETVILGAVLEARR